MNKVAWRKRWLNSINELTSLELQRKSWLDFKNTNPHWSFIEFIECYFDDLALSHNYEKEIISQFVNPKEYGLIKDWHKKLEDYETPNKDDCNHLKILEDEKWIEIVTLGQKAKQNLILILDTSEKQILQEQIKII